MRILFTVRAASGHLHPLVPLAQAARDAGHEVAFAMPPSFEDTIRRLGFEWMSAGPDESSPEYVRFIEQRSRLTGRARAAFNRPAMVTLLAPPMISALLRICPTWRPDVLVRDASDYGGCVAGEMIGIPHAAHEAGGYRSWVQEAIAEPLATLVAANGLPSDPEQRMLERYLVLSPFPRALDGSHGLSRPTLHRYRVVPFDRSGDEGALEWPLPLPGAPLVYATLGTVNNQRTDILRSFIEALRDEHVNVVVTVGRNGDPQQFGVQPPNVRIERYIPQSLLFPACDLVISHGGSGTILAGLDHGIPQVITPIAADQPENAERAAAAGFARVVPADKITAASIREAAVAVLANPTYRNAAEQIRDEMHALPGLAHVIALLERLAIEKAPILA